MGVVVEGARDEGIEPGISSFPGGCHKVWPGHCSEFRPNEHPGSSYGCILRIALGITPFRADVIPRPAGQRRKIDLVIFVRLLNPGSLEVFENHRTEVALVSVAACGQDTSSDMSPEGIISNALSAGPTSITDEAAVSDWDMNEVRAGTNGWTCLPDRSDTDGNEIRGA